MARDLVQRNRFVVDKLTTSRPSFRGLTESSLVAGLGQKIRGAWRNLVSAGDALAPIERNGLVATCLTQWPGDDILPAWDALIDRCPGAMAFHTVIWQRAVWSAFGREGKLRLITVARGDDLLAIVPMQEKEDGSLDTQGQYISDYLEPLVDPKNEATTWQIIFDLLSPKLKVGLVLHNLREGARGIELMKSMAEAQGFTVEQTAVEQTPVLALPATWEDYLATLDAHERKETRRKLNKADTKGGAKLIAAPADADLPAKLTRAVEMMSACGGEKADALRKTVGPLLHQVAPTLIAQGRMQLLILEILGEPAACLVQFPSATGPLLYNSGLDPTKKEWSPGVVAIYLALRDAIGSGAKVYDLLRGQEPYKYRLGAKDRPLYRVTLRG